MAPQLRIVLVTRHYPPAASGGARRPFLLAQALRNEGSNVFVVAPSLPTDEIGLAVPHPNRDPATTIISARKSPRDHARNWLLWPDPDIRWTTSAARAAIKALDGTPDWVLTTSPPESIHAAGLAFKRQWPSVSWAADFRDHWLDAPHRRERMAFHRRIGERVIAKKWIKKMDLITCVDHFVADELNSLGAKRAKVLAHFAPPNLGRRTNLPADSINIVHAGSIALSDPLASIEDILRLYEKALEITPSLMLHFVGRLTDKETRILQKSSASAAITIHGVKSYEDALSYISAADGLIYVASTKSKVPPSKIVEYLATDKPIIACGDGPWRRDLRVSDVDPALQLSTLRKGDIRAAGERPPSAAETAARLLGLMNAGH